jgi:SAM-dependent methyltransferase
LSPPPSDPPHTSSDPRAAEWRARTAAFHEELVERRGEGWQAFWGSIDSQRVRYEVLMQELPLDGAAVLEVGCGFGDFLDHAESRGVRPRSYLGVDVSERMVQGARARHLEARFEVLDVLSAEPPLLPDFVIASGIMAVEVPDYEGYVLRVLRRLHELGRRGFGLNFLSTCTQKPDGVSRYVEPAWLLSLFQRHVDWRCRLIHDYRPNDFTLIHRKG